MLDGGPARTSRATDRRTVYRTEPAPQQPSGERPGGERPEPVTPRRSVDKPKKQKSTRGGIVFAIIISVVILAITGWLIFTSTRSASLGTAIDSNKFQAVFLVGGQIYFGKLEEVNSQYLKLSNVFYIKPATTETTPDPETQTSETSQNDMTLVKLGDEVHGPEDAMMINRDQLLFFENLRSDGRVVQLIQNHTSGQR